MTNGANSTTEDRHELREKLKESRRSLSEAASKLRRDREISSEKRETEIKEVNRLRKTITFELGRINEDAIRTRDKDPEILQLLQQLDTADDKLAVARRDLQKATASAQEAVEVIGSVEGVLKAFADLALKFA